MKPLTSPILSSRLPSKGSSDGFTLVELLVVIIIMGILAAIAMPAFLGQTAKARQSSGKMGIGSINRAQLRYRTENDRFSTSFDELAVGVGLIGNKISTTETYTYNLDSSDIRTNTTITADPINTADRAYSGGNLNYVNSANLPINTALICEADTPGNGQISVVEFISPNINCPGNYHLIN